MTRRRKTILACAAMVALVGGWLFFPSYILLPDLLDYCILKSEIKIDSLSWVSLRKIGGRGSVRFITWLLSSRDPNIARAVILAAMNGHFYNPDNEAQNKLVFSFIAASVIENHRNFRFPEMYSRDDYDALESRGLAIFYLFFYGKKLKLSDEETRLLSFIKENRLTAREKEYLDLGEKHQWPENNPWRSSSIKDVQEWPIFR